MALTFINANTSNGNTVVIPTHQVGDLIVLASVNGGGNGLTTKPAASGTVPAWADIDAVIGTNNCSMRTAQFVATATTTTSGIWLGSDRMVAVVLRNQGASPIGGHAEAGAAAIGSATAPAVTLSRTDNSSILLHFMFYDTSTGFSAWNAPPTGYTQRASVVSSNSGVVLITKDVVTSSTGVINANNGTTSAGYRGATVETLSVPVNNYTSSPTNVVGITDSVTKNAGRTRTDSVGITDTRTIAQGYARALTDPVGITDRVTITFNEETRVDYLVQTFGTVPSTVPFLVGSGGTSFNRTYINPIHITDAEAEGVGRARTDPVGVTDSTAKAVSRTRTDPVGVTDSTKKCVDLTRFDPVGVTDTATKIVGRAKTDLVGISDIGVTQQNKVRTEIDQVDVTDDVKAVRQAPDQSNAIDFVGVDDTVTLQQGRVRTRTDPENITDSMKKGVGRTRTDPVGIHDTTGFIANYRQALTDPVGVTDSVSFQLTTAQTDLIDLTDGVTLTSDYVLAFTDPVGITESTAFQGKLNYFDHDDPVGITDTATPYLWGMLGNTVTIASENRTVVVPPQNRIRVVMPR